MRTICTLSVRNFIYGHRRVGTWRIGCFSFALALLLGITADWCLTARACACATALLVSDELDPPPTLTSVLVEVCDDDSCAARFLAGFGLPIDPQSSAALVTAGVVRGGGFEPNVFAGGVATGLTAYIRIHASELLTRDETDAVLGNGVMVVVTHELRIVGLTVACNDQKKPALGLVVSASIRSSAAGSEGGSAVSTIVLLGEAVSALNAADHSDESSGNGGIFCSPACLCECNAAATAQEAVNYLAFKSCIFGVLAAQALTNLSCLAICAPALPGGGVFYLPCLKFCVGRVNAGFVKEYLACVVLLEAARTVTFAVHQECRLQCGGA